MNYKIIDKWWNKVQQYVLFILSFLLFSCEHPDLTVVVPNENLRPASDFIKNNYEMTLFSAALEKVGLTETLNEKGPYTVLVPTDDAFNELGIFRPSDFDKMDLDSLKKVIQYHILPRRMLLRDIPSNGVDVRYATLAGTELYASLGSVGPNGGTPANELFFSGAKATRKDVILSNGVLYVLDKMMKPHFDTHIQGWLAARPVYSVFVSGLKKFGLWDQLATGGPFTIFAPTNEALAEVGITSESLRTLSPENYRADVLFGAYILYNKHFFVSDSKVLSVINSSGIYKYNLKNNPHEMSFSGAEAYPSFVLSYFLRLRADHTVMAPVIAEVSYGIGAKMDYLCRNGVVHDLDRGLVKPEQAIK